MKIENPNHVAFFIAGTLTVIGLIVLIPVQWVTPGFMPLWGWIVFALVSFGASFALSWWAIEKFLHIKIMTLYRALHVTENVEEKVQAAIRSRDALAEVQRDVKDWASHKQSEIKTLKEQARFRRDFIGNLAHELKTPIFNMQGYLMTLIEGGLEDPKINYDYLNRADKNLQRLIALVEDLDGISKLEAGNQVLKPEKFNVVRLSDEVFSQFDLRARECEVELRFDKKYDKAIWVHADKHKIQQVLANLIANAINYGHTGGFCEIRFFDMSQTILIEVADDGPGISPEHLPRLFERFYRVDKSRSRNEGGTGLGLAICKHIIESHGKTISVRSVPDKGTTFSFTLEKAK